MDPESALTPARIAVVGAGALGCALLPRVVRLPLAKLTIIDGDLVEAANLHRQALYEGMDVGHPKASTAAMWLRQLPLSGTVEAHDVFIDPANATALLRDHDLVLECVDDLHAKNLIERTCGQLGIPVISGALHRKEAQVLVLHAPGEGQALTRADIFSGKVGAEQDGCDMRAVPEAVIEEAARRMLITTHAWQQGEAIHNGSLALFQGNAWIELAP